MNRRLGPWSWLVVFALITGLQFLVVRSGLPDAGKAAGVLLLQVMLLPPTVARLRDLGRPPDDVVWMLVPVGNLLLALVCLRGTPSEGRRQAAIASWDGQLAALSALGRAVPVLGRTAAVGVPLLIAYSVIGALVGRWVVWQLATLEAMDPTARESLSTALWAVLAFLGLYSAIQLTKSASASRLSWLPTLFFAPLLIVTLVITFVEQAKTGMGLALMVFLQQAWTMLWMSIGGAATAIGWVRSADLALEEREILPGDVFAEVGRRTLEVAGPHGARVQGVAIGMQVLVPGILYWLQLAFTDMIAVLHPDRPALRESGRLTYGMRGRLFKVFLLTTVIGLAGSGLVAMAMGMPLADAGMSLVGLGDPREPSVAQILMQEIWFGVQAWWVTVALLLLYRDRLARQAKRAAAAAVPAAPAVAG